MLAVLACLLAAFITPSAHAAATYDITQVGDADWVGITDSNGNDATKTPLASNGANVRVTFDVHIEDMSRLAEGDTVTVSFGAASGSHYSSWGLFDLSNLPRVMRNRSGVDMFTLTAPNAHTLLMTRADEPEDVDAKTGLAGAAGIGAVMLAVGLPPIHWTCGRRRVIRHTTDPYRPIE